MSITSVQNNAAVLATTQPQTAPKAQEAKPPETPKGLVKDSAVIEIQSGVVPTLKGAGAGLLGGAAAAGIPIALLAAMAKGGSGDGGAGLVAFTLGAAAAVVGGAAGTAGGAVAANTTSSKGKGALIGAGVGALAGAATLGAIGKGNIGTIVVGAVGGAIFGAAGGAAGSMVAKEQ